MTSEPTGELDARFSAPDAVATPWSVVDDVLRESQIFWLATIAAGPRPHITPLMAVWDGEAIYFCTGPSEQKARNLEREQHCSLTTGGSSLTDGLDIVVNGRATPLTDDARLRVIAAEYEDKYGSDWSYSVADGAFVGDGGRTLVFRVGSPVIYAFAKGEFAQTRFRL
jgi:nitroimidazol reductase NimA-like FMN-containing flavoprotein (pyridoxamine 5'-phosphate oxidase superfamily)